MSRLAQIEGMGPKIAQQMTTILFSLHKDLDSSIRKRALDLLYVICDKDNSRKITQELLDFLRVADWVVRNSCSRSRFLPRSLRPTSVGIST